MSNPDSLSMITVPESGPVLAAYIEQQNRHPALTPFSTATVVEMPCCGFRFEAEAIDCVPSEWSKVYSPLRWTCPTCVKTWAAGENGLEEAISLAT